MNERLFRKKSIEHFSSPEQLNDYIKVSTPGIWMVLVSIILLLAGICVWGIFGRLDTKLPVAAVVSDGQITCYAAEDDIASVEAGMPVELNGEEYSVAGIADTPEKVTDDMENYFLHVGGFTAGEWMYSVNVGITNLPDGIYQAEIVTDRVSPMSFVVN